MSSVFWVGFGPRTYGLIGETEYPAGGAWVLDITTESGSTQMFFYTAYPSVGAMWEDEPPIFGYDALTLTDSDNTAATLQSAVNDLEVVTDSTLTAFGISTNGGFSLLFGSEEWANYSFSISLPTQDDTNTDSAQLTTRSPADGILSSEDIGTVTAAIVTFIEGLDTVTACTVTQQTVTPSTL